MVTILLDPVEWPPGGYIYRYVGRINGKSVFTVNKELTPELKAKFETEYPEVIIRQFKEHN